MGSKLMPKNGKQLGVVHFPDHATEPGLDWAGLELTTDTGQNIRCLNGLSNFVDAEQRAMPDTGLIPSAPSRLGINPQPCCPGLEMDVACAGDDDPDLESNEIFYEIAMVKDSNYKFRELRVSSELSEFPTTLTVKCFKQIIGDFQALSPVDSMHSNANGQWIVIPGSRIKSLYLNLPDSEARFQIMVNANSAFASGLFKTKIFTQYPPPDARNIAGCCRKAVDGVAKDMISTAQSPEPDKELKSKTVKAEWRMFPNPAGSQLSVESQEGGWLDVVDPIGKKAMERLWVQSKILITLDRMPNGIYQVMLTTSSGVSSKTLSIQR